MSAHNDPTEDNRDVNLRVKYQSRIETWLRDVIGACQARGLFCSDARLGGLLPISEPEWFLEIRSEEGGIEGIILTLSVIGTEQGDDDSESFRLRLFWTDFVDGARTDDLLDLKPYHPDVWAAGPEARLKEVLIPPYEVARVCAIKVEAKEDESPRGRRSSRRRAAIPRFMLLAMPVAMWAVGRGELMFGYWIGIATFGLLHELDQRNLRRREGRRALIRGSSSSG
jgi:hypothetical protein